MKLREFVPPGAKGYIGGNLCRQEHDGYRSNLCRQRLDGNLGLLCRQEHNNQ